MPKGLKCPVCERFTVHPLTTNWRQCSNCRTKMPEKGILVVLRKNKPKVLLRKSKTLEKALLVNERARAQKRVTMPDFQKRAVKNSRLDGIADRGTLERVLLSSRQAVKGATKTKDSK